MDVGGPGIVNGSAVSEIAALKIEEMISNGAV